MDTLVVAGTLYGYSQVGALWKFSVQVIYTMNRKYIIVHIICPVYSTVIIPTAGFLEGGRRDGERMRACRV